MKGRRRIPAEETSSSKYRGADGRWHARVTMGARLDGRTDRKHISRGTKSELDRGKWDALGREHSILGYPTTDEASSTIAVGTSSFSAAPSCGCRAPVRPTTRPDWIPGVWLFSMRERAEQRGGTFHAAAVTVAACSVAASRLTPVKASRRGLEVIQLGPDVLYRRRPDQTSWGPSAYVLSLTARGSVAPRQRPRLPP